jgi:hypothetical protein
MAGNSQAQPDNASPAMWTIMITCPTTGRPISTGILTDQANFSRLTHLPGTMLCTDCGERHQWAVSYAWLAPADHK